MKVVAVDNGQIGLVLEETELKLLATYIHMRGSEAWGHASERWNMPTYDSAYSVRLKEDLVKAVKNHFG